MEYRIIPTPHLPTGEVCHLLCGRLPDEMSKTLRQYVSELIITQPDPNIENALKNHADLVVCPLPERKLILSESQISLKDKLQSLGFCVIMQKDVGSAYPHDCLLNFVNSQYYCIYNENIHNCAKYHSSIRQFSVKQGYVKCSVVPLTENAVITDDPGIAKIARQYDMNVCFVSKGDIALSGYDYGFIGGCCGKLSEHLLAFCGNLESHRDYKKITAFLSQYNIEPINLADTQLTDIGSLIPLTQVKG